LGISADYKEVGMVFPLQTTGMVLVMLTVVYNTGKSLAETRSGTTKEVRRQRDSLAQGISVVLIQTRLFSLLCMIAVIAQETCGDLHHP
jgi:hypothetical protein